MGGLVGGRGVVVWAVQAQLAVAKGGIDEGTVMWARRIVVLKGPEEATRHTHPGHRDAALLLKRTDHRDQGAQEGGLLGDRKLVDRFQQKVGPRSGGGRLADASRGESPSRTYGWLQRITWSSTALTQAWCMASTSSGVAPPSARNGLRVVVIGMSRART